MSNMLKILSSSPVIEFFFACRNRPSSATWLSVKFCQNWQSIYIQLNYASVTLQLKDIVRKITAIANMSHCLIIHLFS
jgi:hypothetical protein